MRGPLDTKTFFDAVLPDGGIFFIATPREQGGFYHYPCESHAGMELKAEQLEEEGLTVYFATASFRERFIMVMNKKTQTERRRYRTKENVENVRAFWLDLDVGSAKAGQMAKYPSQIEAGKALGTFVKDTGLPSPMVVSSGYGLHIYWPLTKDIPVAMWSATADRLKRLCAARGLLADPTRTADAASILRPVGTTNRKAGGSAKVTLAFYKDNPTDPAEFAQIVDSACEEFKVETPTVKQDPTRRLNDEFAVARERNLPPPNGEEVAEKCRQIRVMRDTKGNLPEPLWYASMQVLRLAPNGRELCHEWSKGYDGYDEVETDRKLDQLEEGGFGPALCSTFEGRNPTGCKGCPFKGKISSPAQLGTTLTEPEPEKVAERTEVGAPKEGAFVLPSQLGLFRRAKEGLFADVDGVQVKFYDYDLYPVTIVDDDFEGEQIQVRRWLPMDGWGEFKFNSTSMADLFSFKKAMLENSIHPYLDQRHGEHMRSYMDTYIRNIREKQQMQKLISSFGWKPDMDYSFVSGKQVYRLGAEPIEASVNAERTNNRELQFHAAGDKDQWVALTKMLDQPNMEAHAFSFATAFAGPLVMFTGFKGCIFSMTGETNVGKSTMAVLGSTVYGAPECNWIGAGDTELSIYTQLGLLKNLPAYIDEVTNIEPELMSRLVYAAANGTARGRLKSDGTMADRKSWNTSCLVSLNRSVYGILAGTEGDTNAEPEKVRVLEYLVPRVASFEDNATLMMRTLKDNYGHAGPVYLRWLVDNRTKLKPMIESVIDRITKEVGDTKPRYMIAGAACTLVGASIAKKLGLIDFDVQRLLPWAVSSITAAMAAVGTGRQSARAVLAEFLDKHISSRLAVERLSAELDGKQYRVVKLQASGSPLTQRMDITQKVVWINEKVFTTYCNRIRENPKLVLAELEEAGIITGTNKLVTLGKYIAGYDGRQVRCIEIQMEAAGLDADLEMQVETQEPA